MSRTGSDCFRFIQLDVPGGLGLDDGRYLLRAAGDDGETVIVVQTLGALAPTGKGLRRRRPRPAEPAAAPVEVPVTRLTVIPADMRSPDQAERELDVLAADGEAAEDAVIGGLRAANRLIRAHRIASQDPYGHEIGRSSPVTVRVGYGTGGELADGRWTRALDVPAPERRRRRTEAVRPQERLAELLAGREQVEVYETLLLRARADLDQGRLREAALQLAPGLESLLAELPAGAGPGQEEDLAALRERREQMARVSADAVRGELAAAQARRVAETLVICERVLRRRQALRDAR
jgi:hypothetical protein